MGKSGTSIADSNVIDMDELMSDDFDIERYLSVNRKQSFNTAQKYLDREDLINEARTDEFFRKLGITDAKASPMKMITATNAGVETKDLFPFLKQSWDNANLTMDIADVRLAELDGRITAEEGQRRSAELHKGMVDGEASWWLPDWLGSAASLMPMIIETSRLGLVGGASGATVAAIAGQAGPQIAFPEEIATVPAGFALGFTAGAAVRGGEIEAALAYDELMNMTDAEGNKIDPSIAKPIAVTVGVINGALEVAGIDDLIKTIPGGKGLFNRAKKKAIASTLKSPTFRRVLFGAAKRATRHVAFETGVESLQEADTILWGEVAKAISNEFAGTKMEFISLDEFTNRMVETMKQAAKGFIVLGAPGNIANVVYDLGDVAVQKTIRKPDGTTEEVTVISTDPNPDVRAAQWEAEVLDYKPLETPAPRSSERIIPRVDPLELGQDVAAAAEDAAGATIPAEATPEAAKPAEELVGPPEAAVAELIQKGQEVGAVENLDEVIQPNLYIGNVTQRMKNALAGALDIDPSRILGFMEDGVPTKRTKIGLTRREGYSLLFWLEEHLDSLLKNNQINTYNDMAKANADWGDVKALRTTLGLEQTKRPWRVIKADQTKVEVILNTKRRATEAITPSLKDKATGTKIDQLNTLIRRIAKATKEGMKLQRGIHAEVAYLKRQIVLRNKAISSIKKPASENIDFFYREAISSLQDAIDFESTSAVTKKSKEGLRTYLEKNPDAVDEIDKTVVEALDKKDVGDLSFAELKQIDNEIKRLRKLGKLKSKLFKAQRKKRLNSIGSEVTRNVKNAPKSKLPSKVTALTLRPPRIFDMLDGGKKFAGKIYKFFYGVTNRNTDIELQNADERHKSLTLAREELGINLNGLTRKITIGDLKMTVDDFLSIYAGWQNPFSRAALMNGGVVQNIKGKPVTTLITEKIYNQVVEGLSPAEKKLADMIIKEYMDNYTRLRNTIIEAENRDPGREENYTKIRRKGISFDNQSESLQAEIEERAFYRSAGIHKGFSIERKNIPAEYQTPIETGLVKIWMQEVSKQEHYIAHAVHIKDMRAIVSNKDFKNSVEGKFGEAINTMLKRWIDSIASPDFYKNYGDMERLSRTLRKNAAIAYLAFRWVTIAKQAPSLLLFWSKSSSSDMYRSISRAVLDPRGSYNKAIGIHYQLSHQVIEREIAELQAEGSTAYSKLVGTVGRTGMWGILMMDKVVKTIGINAVYDKALRDGYSPLEAEQIAILAVVNTQPAARAKDLAQIYTTSEFLNWFTMFTNQLNQLYNISVYDIPRAFKNGDYRDAYRSALSLGLMSVLIKIISDKGLPEEPEDIGVAIVEQTAATLPIIGSAASGAIKGYGTSGPAPLQSAAGVANAGKALAKGDIAKAAKALAKPVAVTAGVPYQAVKDIVEFTK